VWPRFPDKTFTWKRVDLLPRLLSVVSISQCCLKILVWPRFPDKTFTWKRVDLEGKERSTGADSSLANSRSPCSDWMCVYMYVCMCVCVRVCVCVLETREMPPLPKIPKPQPLTLSRQSHVSERKKTILIGLARTIYVRCIYGILSREMANIRSYTVSTYSSGQP
jgi:hypothetical protein